MDERCHCCRKPGPVAGWWLDAAGRWWCPDCQPYYTAGQQESLPFWRDLWPGKEGGMLVNRLARERDAARKAAEEREMDVRMRIVVGYDRRVAEIRDEMGRKFMAERDGLHTALDTERLRHAKEYKIFGVNLAKVTADLNAARRMLRELTDWVDKSGEHAFECRDKTYYSAHGACTCGRAAVLARAREVLK